MSRRRLSRGSHCSRSANTTNWTRSSPEPANQLFALAKEDWTSSSPFRSRKPRRSMKRAARRYVVSSASAIAILVHRPAARRMARRCRPYAPSAGRSRSSNGMMAKIAQGLFNSRIASNATTKSGSRCATCRRCRPSSASTGNPRRTRRSASPSSARRTCTSSPAISKPRSETSSRPSPPPQPNSRPPRGR